MQSKKVSRTLHEIMNTQDPIEHPTITDTQSLVAITVIIILYLQFINAMMCHNLTCM